MRLKPGETGRAAGTKVWLVLMKAHRAMEKRSLESIGGTGMCFTDFAVLEALLHKGPLAVNQIGPKVGLTSGSTTTAVDRLERRGLVRREADPEDRRSRIVQLTSGGKSLIARVFARHSADIEQVTSRLTAGEREQLVGLLKKLGMAAEEAEPPRKIKRNGD